MLNDDSLASPPDPSTSILPSPPLAHNDSRISRLMTFARSSKAVKHPYLEALQSGSLPNMALALQDFASQYRALIRSHEYLLQAILERLPDTSGNITFIQELLNKESGKNSEGARYLALFERLQKALQIPIPQEYCTSILKWESKMLEMCHKSGINGIGAVIIGLEWTLPPVYASIHSADLRFFSLQIQPDNTTVELEIHSLALSMAKDKTSCRALEEGLQTALKYQALFWDDLHTRALKMKPAVVLKPPPIDQQNPRTDWLEDLRRRRLLQMCEPVQDLRVLEIGCGQVVTCRALIQKGAASVTGATSTLPTDLSDIEYVKCHPLDLIETLRCNSLQLQYDLVVTTNSFEDMTTDETLQMMIQVRALLAPKGRFIFSTIHPSLPFAWTTVPKARRLLSIGSGNGDYFKDRGQLLQGKLALANGYDTSVKVLHKTTEDLMLTLKRAGMTDFHEIKECTVDDSVPNEVVKRTNGIPLHTLFSVSAPDMTRTLINVSKVVWKSLPDNFEIRIPASLLDAFDQVYKNATDLGHSWESLSVYSSQGDLLADQLKTTLQLPSTTGRDLFDDQKRLILPGSLQKEFQLLSAQIQYAVNGEINDNCPGFVILTGLILENYKEQHREPLSRLFYLLLSWHLGDLIYQNEKSRFADIHSGSQTERWISESADRFTIPDTTGFLYTRKEKQQIEDSDQNDIILANAANAYHSLFDKVPISVLRHLQAPIIRQKPEKNLSKTDILSNVYPVFQHSNSHLPFICRYSRQGIEQGYKDRELSLPERLTWGMDAFEECLNSGIQVGVKMKPGQMLFLNNRLIVCQSNGTSSAKMVKAWLHSRQ